MSSVPPELLRAIQVADETGTLVYGARSVKKLLLHGKAKAVVIAANAPPELKQDIKYYAKLSGIPVIKFNGTNIELGSVLGRPHGILVLAIVNPGQSNILEIAEKVGAVEQQ